ncbi:hypothetical protein HOF65_00800 [bacterium]|nr:hypothetical protein [bacterium]
MELSVLISKLGHIFSNFLNMSTVLSMLSILTICVSIMSHSSIHSDIYIIVNQVSVSQFFIDS